MNYRKFGKAKIEVSEIGMGLEHLLDKDEQTVIDTIRVAFDSGVTYLDCHPAHDCDGMLRHYETSLTCQLKKPL